MKTLVTASLASLCLLLGTGCQSTETSESTAELEARVAKLEAKMDVLIAGQNARQPAGVAAAPAPQAAPSSAPSESPKAASSAGTPLWKSLNFDSLPSPERLKEITSLGFLPKVGIVDQKTLKAGSPEGSTSL